MRKLSKRIFCSKGMSVKIEQVYVSVFYNNLQERISVREKIQIYFLPDRYCCSFYFLLRNIVLDGIIHLF